MGSTEKPELTEIGKLALGQENTDYPTALAFSDDGSLAVGVADVPQPFQMR
jgi:hypothetical protein